jgi:hypothetical protein
MLRIHHNGVTNDGHRDHTSKLHPMCCFLSARHGHSGGGDDARSPHAARPSLRARKLAALARTTPTNNPDAAVGHTIIDIERAIATCIYPGREDHTGHNAYALFRRSRDQNAAGAAIEHSPRISEIEEQSSI